MHMVELIKKSIQDRPPNFRGLNEELFLVRCFVCEPNQGRENYMSMVASGQCTFCGWKENKPRPPVSADEQYRIQFNHIIDSLRINRDGGV